MKRLIGATLALGLTAAASATSVNLTFDGYGAGLRMKLSYQANQNFSAVNRASGSNLQVKEHNFTNTANSRQMRNYCVQVFESVSPGNTYSYDEVAVENVPDFPPGPGPMGSIRAALMRNLYGRFYSQVSAGTDNVKCAAFALLVWEISHENLTGAGANATAVLNSGALNVRLGAFQVSATSGLTGNNLAAYNQAQSWIATMVAQSNILKNNVNIYGLTNPLAQDHIGVMIPVPAPALLAGLGLVGVVSGRRRSR